MQLLTIAFVVVAFVAWIVAAGSALAMVNHRADGVSLVYLATHGLAFFDDQHFKPEAAPHRRRFLAAFGAFFVASLAVVVVVVATATPS